MKATVSTASLGSTICAIRLSATGFYFTIPTLMKEGYEVHEHELPYVEWEKTLATAVLQIAFKRYL
jgi:hypothetical protein